MPASSMTARIRFIGTILVLSVGLSLLQRLSEHRRVLKHQYFTTHYTPDEGRHSSMLSIEAYGTQEPSHASPRSDAKRGFRVVSCAEYSRYLGDGKGKGEAYYEGDYEGEDK